MLKFISAYMCKSGVVGMEFMVGKGKMAHVFHDGKALQTSEDVHEGTT